MHPITVCNYSFAFFLGSNLAFCLHHNSLHGSYAAVLSNLDSDHRHLNPKERAI